MVANPSPTLFLRLLGTLGKAKSGVGDGMPVIRPEPDGTAMQDRRSEHWMIYNSITVPVG